MRPHTMSAVAEDTRTDGEEIQTSAVAEDTRTYEDQIQTSAV